MATYHTSENAVNFRLALASHFLRGNGESRRLFNAAALQNATTEAVLRSNT
jgi:hypothetical protein